MAEIDANIQGVVVGRASPNYTEDQTAEISVDNMGLIQVAQALPELSGIVRLGQSYQVALATGLAALGVLPTTVAGLSLWNGEPATGKCYVIDSFGSWEAVADATQEDNTAIFAMNNVTPVTAPTATALTIRSLSGRIYGGKGRPVSALTVTNDGWFAHGAEAQSSSIPSSITGDVWRINEAKVRGLYLVPPGGCFNVQAVKAAAQAAAQHFFFIRWHEVQIIFNP